MYVPPCLFLIFPSMTSCVAHVFPYCSHVHLIELLMSGLSGGHLVMKEMQLIGHVLELLK